MPRTKIPPAGTHRRSTRRADENGALPARDGRKGSFWGMRVSRCLWALSGSPPSVPAVVHKRDGTSRNGIELRQGGSGRVLGNIYLIQW